MMPLSNSMAPQSELSMCSSVLSSEANFVKQVGQRVLGTAASDFARLVMRFLLVPASLDRALDVICEGFGSVRANGDDERGRSPNAANGVLGLDGEAGEDSADEAARGGSEASSLGLVSLLE